MAPLAPTPSREQAAGSRSADGTIRGRRGRLKQAIAAVDGNAPLSRFTRHLGDLINGSAKTQRQIAAEIGYAKSNIITMFKQGTTRVPVDRIGLLASALEVDAGDLLRLWLTEYEPEMLAVVERHLGPVLSTTERAWIEDLRQRFPEGIRPANLVASLDDAAVTSNQRQEAALRVLERIPGMSELDLDQLERNARRRPQASGAQQVLEAVAAERQARRAREIDAARSAAEALATKIRDMALADRIELAFRELPPTAAQIHRLRLLHAHPGRDEYELADIAGDNGPSAFNLIIGGLCQERRHYLPEPGIAERRAAPVWSELICDLVPHDLGNGRVVHHWTLKPEATEALRRLGYVA